MTNEQAKLAVRNKLRAQMSLTGVEGVAQSIEGDVLVIKTAYGIRSDKIGEMRLLRIERFADLSISDLSAIKTGNGKISLNLLNLINAEIETRINELDF